MAKFEEAYKIGRVNEGGYADVAGDKGGETYGGVARNYWPTWPGWKIIDIIKKGRKIKHGEVIKNAELEGHLFNFYYKEFWSKIMGDSIKDQSVANFIYDWTLTSGGAIPQIQAMLGLKADGDFGPMTLKAVNTIDTLEEFNKLKSLRSSYYRMLAQKNASNGKFLAGWLNRVASFVYKAVGK